MNSKITIALVALVLLGGAAWYQSKNQPAGQPGNSQEQEQKQPRKFTGIVYKTGQDEVSGEDVIFLRGAFVDNSGLLNESSKETISAKLGSRTDITRTAVKPAPGGSGPLAASTQTPSKVQAADFLKDASGNNLVVTVESLWEQPNLALKIDYYVQAK